MSAPWAPQHDAHRALLCWLLRGICGTHQYLRRDEQCGSAGASNLWLGHVPTKLLESAWKIRSESFSVQLLRVHRNLGNLVLQEGSRLNLAAGGSSGSYRSHLVLCLPVCRHIGRGVYVALLLRSPQGRPGI